MILALNSTLRNVQIIENQGETIGVSTTVPVGFILPPESETVAINITASVNLMRVFDVINSTFTLRESYFDGNRVNAMTSDAQESVGGSVLISNRSIIHMVESVFVNNFGQNGGSVYSISSEYNVSNCIFRENDAGVGSGGAIYAVNQSSFIFTSCTFSKNNADRGAGVFTSYTSLLQFLDTRFWENTANNGAGLFIANGNMIIESCEFHQNNCSFGGAVVTSFVNGMIRNTNFFDNNSTRGGACCFQLNSTMSIEGSVFDKNHAEISASAILIHESTVDIRDTEFINNDVAPTINETDLEATFHYFPLFHGPTFSLLDDHGTVFIQQSNTNFTRVLFENNTVDRFGGGVFARSSNVTINESSFANNSAGWSGGAIYGTDRSQLQILDTSIYNNTAKREASGTGGGGGAFLDAVATTMQNVNFSSNKASFDSGGGLYLRNGRFNGDSLSFIDNQAVISGGGIYAEHLILLSLSKSLFRTNFGLVGGAIDIQNTTLDLSSSCALVGNVGGVSGGGIYQIRSNSSLSSCYFEANRALSGGSIWIGLDSKTNISNCTFTRSTATSNGGGILSYNDSRITLTNSSFSACSANRGGGAIDVNQQSNLIISSCSFALNIAPSGAGVLVLNSSLTVNTTVFKQNHVNTTGRNFGAGGAIDSFHGTIDIQRSDFRNNIVANGLGGALFFQLCNVTIKDSRLIKNQATNAGGIFAIHYSYLNATRIIFHSNVALLFGGGVEIRNGSSLLCTSCIFRDNVARWGAGLYVQSNDSNLVTAQLQDCTFTNNTAFSLGGGLLFSRPLNLSIDCNRPNITCGHVVLLHTRFVDNTASFSGAAILTSDPEGVLFTCNNTDTQTEFIDRQDFNSLDLVHPKRLCKSWRRNHVTNNAHGGVIGNYGRHLSFSTASNGEVQIVGDVDSGFVFLNALSGRQLPTVNITVVDSYGNGPVPTIPNTLKATISSPENFFQGSIPIDITYGSGQFFDIAGFKKAGNYTITVLPNAMSVNEVNITVIVRSCLIGEEPTSDDVLCQSCDAASYNFDPTEAHGCSPCPIEATCEERFIVPKDGYWHKTPCQINVEKCLTEEACSYSHRRDNLMYFSTEFFDCKFNQSILIYYGEVLCREGYEGPLCGSCTTSYGLSMSFECSKCPHASASVITLILLSLYLLAIAAFTIRGGLPLKIKTQVSFARSVSSVSFEEVQEQSRDVDINVQMVEWRSQSRMSSPYFQTSEVPTSSHSAPSSSNEISPIHSSELELTKWITSEIFKVMINYLQVTAVAASIDLNWSEGVLTMFESSDYVGAMTMAAVSAPVDCLVASHSAAVRSVWRTLLSLFVPGTVMGIFIIMWGIITYREDKGMFYFWKRVMLTVVAVVYISYLGLTELAVSVFYCVDVHNSDDPFSYTSEKYLAIDASIKCYTKEHVGLIVIGVIILVLVSFSFPSMFAVVLFTTKGQRQQNNNWIFETMGFLYRAFKEKFIFWESVVMLRKACLSVIVVFSYPLGGTLQGHLALGVLLFCLFLQLICYPYRQEFHRVNYYESGSLLVSCFTFIFGQIINDEACSASTRTFVEVMTIIMNICFFTFLLFTFCRSGMNHIKVVLISENYPIDDKTHWWVLLKIFVKHRMSNTSCFKN
eukprot:g351.t1